jgi:hypothetical protein
MRKYIEWYKKDPNDTPTFVGVLAIPNKLMFWFAFIMFICFAVKIAQSINL